MRLSLLNFLLLFLFAKICHHLFNFKCIYNNYMQGKRKENILKDSSKGSLTQLGTVESISD